MREYLFGGESKQNDPLLFFDPITREKELHIPLVNM